MGLDGPSSRRAWAGGPAEAGELPGWQCGPMLRILLLCMCFFPLPRELLTSLSVVMGFSASPFTSLRFCSMHFEILLLGAYTFRVVVYSG